MIEQPEAEKITEDCIRETVSTNEEYSADKPLGKYGLQDEDFISTFIQFVADDKDIGVPSCRKHKIDADVFGDIGPDTLCGEVEDLIMDNAVQPQAMTATAKKVKGLKNIQRVQKVQNVQKVQRVQKAPRVQKVQEAGKVTKTTTGRKGK